jgi:hypothetical protein
MNILKQILTTTWALKSWTLKELVLEKSSENHLKKVIKLW